MAASFILERPLSPTTFKAAIELLGLSVEQVAYDLGVAENTVLQWRKKSRPLPEVTDYILGWLERTDQDLQAAIRSAEDAIEAGQPFVVLETAWSSQGMKQLPEHFHDYPAKVHMALTSRIFAELVARRIPCRVEYKERQGLESRLGEPEPHFGSR